MQQCDCFEVGIRRKLGEVAGNLLKIEKIVSSDLCRKGAGATLL